MRISFKNIVIINCIGMEFVDKKLFVNQLNELFENKELKLTDNITLELKTTNKIYNNILLSYSSIAPDIINLICDYAIDIFNVNIQFNITKTLASQLQKHNCIYNFNIKVNNVDICFEKYSFEFFYAYIYLHNGHFSRDDTYLELINADNGILMCIPEQKIIDYYSEDDNNIYQNTNILTFVDYVRREDIDLIKHHDAMCDLAYNLILDKKSVNNNIFDKLNVDAMLKNVLLEKVFLNIDEFIKPKKKYVNVKKKKFHKYNDFSVMINCYTTHNYDKPDIIQSVNKTTCADGGVQNKSNFVVNECRYLDNYIHVNANVGSDRLNITKYMITNKLKFETMIDIISLITNTLTSGLEMHSKNTYQLKIFSR
jgi:hypothetical protein